MEIWVLCLVVRGPCKIYCLGTWVHVHVTYRLVVDKTWTRGRPDWWESQSQLPWLLYNPCTWLIELSGHSLWCGTVSIGLSRIPWPQMHAGITSPSHPPSPLTMSMSDYCTMGQPKDKCITLLSSPPSPPFPHFNDQVHVRLFQHGNNWRCASVAKASNPVGVSKGRRSDYRGRCQWLCKWGHILPTWSLWSDTG